MTTEVIEETTETEVETTPAPAPKAKAPAKTKAADPAPAPSEPESTPTPDWRDRLAGDDKKFRKDLDRYTDEPSFANAFKEVRARATDPRRVVIPDADASEEEIKAWNKTQGIPETPDKYKITTKPPEGMELTEIEKERLSAITANLHKLGGVMALPAVINAAHKVFYDERAEAEAQMEANATIQKEKSEAFLKKLWEGPEFKRNLAFADQAIQHFFGKDFAEIKDMQFVDGTRLGDHPAFAQAFAKIGRLTMEDPVFLEAGRNGADPMESLNAEKQRIMAMRVTDKAKYNSPEVQKRLAEIYDAQARHEERAQAQH